MAENKNVCRVFSHGSKVFVSQMNQRIQTFPETSKRFDFDCKALNTNKQARERVVILILQLQKKRLTLPVTKSMSSSGGDCHTQAEVFKCCSTQQKTVVNLTFLTT